MLPASKHDQNSKCDQGLEIDSGRTLRMPAGSLEKDLSFNPSQAHFPNTSWTLNSRRPYCRVSGQKHLSKELINCFKTGVQDLTLIQLEWVSPTLTGDPHRRFSIWDAPLSESRIRLSNKGKSQIVIIDLNLL